MQNKKSYGLEVIEVPDHMQMAEMLVDGQADIMTGFLMPSNSIEKKV